MHLGWVVAGEINSLISPLRNIHCYLAMHSTSLDSNLAKFWEIEEVPSVKQLSAEEKACEEHFVKNIERNSEGRYIVRLPFNEYKTQLGKSYSTASRRFHYLETRFVKNPNLKEEYIKFLEEDES